MLQTLSAVYIHLVFSTKERFSFLRDREVRQATFAYFQDELRTLLRRHQIEFGERYVWD